MNKFDMDVIMKIYNYSIRHNNCTYCCVVLYTAYLQLQQWIDLHNYHNYIEKQWLLLWLIQQTLLLVQGKVIQQFTVPFNDIIYIITPHQINHTIQLITTKTQLMSLITGTDEKQILIENNVDEINELVHQYNLSVI